MHMLTHYCVNTRQKLSGRPPGSKNRLKRANDASEPDEEQEMPAPAQMPVSKDEDSNVRTRTWHEYIALVFERTLCLVDW